MGDLQERRETYAQKGMSVLKKVMKISATVKNNTVEPMSGTKRRVEGYVRVSADHEDKIASYKAQVEYDTSYIQGRGGW